MNEKKTKLELIRYALAERCIVDNEWGLWWWGRYFYTIKAAVCILLGWHYMGREWDWLGDFVTVGIHSFESSYDFAAGQHNAIYILLTVSHGWRTWQYYEMDDGWS